MKRTILFMVVVIILLTSVVWSANKWSQVGTNPTTISLVEAIKILPFTIAKEIVLQEVQNVFPDTAWLRRGDVLKAMTFDDGNILNDVIVTFDSTRVLVWTIDHIQIVLVLGCNNVGWLYSKAHISSSPTQLPAKIIMSTASAHYATPESSKKTDSKGFHFPWWLLPLLLIPLLWWLWRKRKKSKSLPPPVPLPGTTKTPVKDITAVTPVPAPEEKKTEEKIIVTPVVVTSEDSKNKEEVTPLVKPKEEEKVTGEQKTEEPIPEKTKWAVLLEEAQKELAVAEGLEKELQAVSTWLEELKKSNADRKVAQLAIKDVLKKASAFYVEPKKEETTS